MSDETYTNRYREPWTIKSVDDSSITTLDGWSTHAPPEVLAAVKPGDTVIRETQGGRFGVTTGWEFRGQWFDRRSDQKIDADHQAMVDGFARERRERLEANRAEWVGRTENLPGWLQDRIQTFRERGGQTFDLEGWGYELCVAELAVLYDKYPEFDSETRPYQALPQEIRDYDHKHGCSGNQHGMASALAHAHRAGESLAGTVSALSPITGDAFYEGAS